VKRKVSLGEALLVLSFVVAFVTLYLHEYIGAVLGALCFLASLSETTNTHTAQLASVVAALNEQLSQSNSNKETIREAEERVNTEHAEITKRLNTEHDKFVRLLIEMGGLDRSTRAVADMALATPILFNYLAWLRRRYGGLLELPVSTFSIVAPDPDYFTFAAIVLANAEQSVRSTSVVDPHWYDSDECENYIQEQVNNLIKKGKTFTRYFIVNPRLDTKERKNKTVQVIKHQALEGFVVSVVHTDNYQDEIDAAVIDAGRLWVRATVPKQNHQGLPGSITGCECYFKRDPSNNNDVSKLEGYFAKVEGRKHRTFNQANAASIDLAAIYT
jgi:hypothetical protein